MRFHKAENLAYSRQELDFVVTAVAVGYLCVPSQNNKPCMASCRQAMRRPEGIAAGDTTAPQRERLAVVLRSISPPMAFKWEGPTADESCAVERCRTKDAAGRPE